MIMNSDRILKLILQLLKFLFPLVGILFVLPLYLIEPLLWVWFIYMVLNRKQFDWSFNKSKIPLILFFVFFIAEIVSLFYSSNIGEGLKGINTYLPLFLVSLLLYGTPINKIPVIKSVNALVMSIYVGTLICLIFVFYSFIANSSIIPVINISPGRAFEEAIELWMHRSYLALALSLGLVILYLHVRENKGIIIWWLTFFMTFLFVWYSGARLPLFYILLIGLGVGIDILRRHFSLKLLIGLGIIALGIAILVLYQHSGFSVFKNALTLSPDRFIKLDSRFQIWASVKTILENNPITGVGIGDAKEELLKMYATDNFTLGEVLAFNSHNQFLNIWLESGLIGVLFFSMGLVSILFSFNKSPLIIRILYVGIICSAFFVENMFSRAAGREIFLFSLILLYSLNCSSKRSLDVPMAYLKIASLVSLSFIVLLLVFPYNLFFKVNNKDPNTFATGRYSVIQYEDLPTVVPEAIPYDTKGLLYDTLAFKNINKDVNYLLAIFSENKTNFSDQMDASAFVFVSDDYNGGDVFLFSKNKMIEYNVDKSKFKGKWQQLSISHSCVEGELLLGLYLETKKDQSPKDLKGYVIFAYPQYSISRSNQNYED